MQVRHVLPRLAGQVRVDPARQDYVDRDAVGRPGGGEALGQLHHAALGRGIGRVQRHAEDREHGAVVDDAADAARLHVGEGGLARDHGRSQVGGQHGVPVLHPVFLGPAADVGARVVDQDVQPAEALRRGLHHVADGLLVGDVHLDRIGLDAQRAQFGDGARALGRVAAGHHDRGARLGEAAGEAEPDAAIAAGDERHAPLQVEHHAAFTPLVFSISSTKRWNR